MVDLNSSSFDSHTPCTVLTRSTSGDFSPRSGVTHHCYYNVEDACSEKVHLLDPSGNFLTALFDSGVDAVVWILWVKLKGFIL